MNHTNKNNQNILASSLFPLCSDLSTGTLFVLTKNNTSAQFIIKDGVITDFAFENKNGIEAVGDFKSSIYWKSKFIENYQFPLTSSAKIAYGNSLLRELGYDKFLIDRNTQRRNQFNFKCIKPGLFQNNMMYFA